jgi:site-specific DNA-methyltransferase (adenine-specific)
MSNTTYSTPDGNVTLHLADALDFLPTLPANSVDALVCDPPYSSGGAFRGDRMASTTDKYCQTGQKTYQASFSGDNRDQRGFLYWYDLWLRRCRNALKPGAPACLFSDWRQLPATTDAFQAAGLVWRGIAVWAKPGARPQMGRFRAGAEYIVWGSNGPMPARTDVGVLPGVFTHPVLQREKVHQTGKPLALMADIVRICPPGGLILDPFAGSGSTAIACLRTGRRFIGCEADPHYFQVAAARIEAELVAGMANAAA